MGYRADVNASAPDRHARPGGRTLVPGLLAAFALLGLAGCALGWSPHATARATRNGGLILGWRAAPGATTYVVRFLDDGGREIDRIDGIETLELVLTRDALPRALEPGSRVRWTVVALRNGREAGHSPPAPLTLP